MKIVFMGTPDFAIPSLRELIKANHSIELVITQEDKRRGRGKKLHPTLVKEEALKNNIEVYQPKNVNSEESIEIIKNINPDVMIVIAYGQLLSKELLDLPKYGCLNVHASILPKYRGAAPINWAVINGETESGVTVMKISEGLDSGDIIDIAKTSISEDMTAGDLYNRLMFMGGDLIVKTLQNIEVDNYTLTPQDDSKSSYAPTMDKALGEIDWNKNAIDIRNLIRGTQPWPGTYFKYENMTIKVNSATVDTELRVGIPGEIIKIKEKEIYISAKDANLVFERIQAEGKRMMSVEDYLRGNSLKEGTVLKKD